jgi:acetyl esterase/lipase
MPSATRFRHASIVDLDFAKFISYYLGYSTPPVELLEVLSGNNHTLLIKDKSLLEKYKSFTDPSKIPSQYKTGKSYYQTFEIMRDTIYPTTPIDRESILQKDKQVASKLSQLFSPEVSPGLADTEQLKGLPSAIFVQCEVDALKDEGLIYSERLKSAGVHVDVQFYENCFHGSVQLTGDLGFQSSRDILHNLIQLIKNKNI